MSWETWGPAIFSSGIVAIAGLVGGYFLKAFVEKGVQHGFDRQIELVRSELRKGEDDIKSLRSGALANLASRDQEIEKRRLKAAENLWFSTMDLRRYGLVTGLVGALKFTEIERRMQQGEVGKQEMIAMMNVMWTTAGAQQLLEKKADPVDAERLFVPPNAWLAFDALRGLCVRSLAILGTLRAGAEASSLVKSVNGVNDLIAAVLPHRRPYLDSYPESGGIWLIKELEEFIFVELSASFNSSEQFRKTMQAASKLITQVSDSSSEDVAKILPPELKAEQPIFLP